MASTPGLSVDYLSGAMTGRLGEPPADPWPQRDVRGAGKAGGVSAARVSAGGDRRQSTGVHDPLGVYISEVGSVPLLSADEEVVLAKRIAERVAELRRALLRIPFTARFLVRRCDETRSRRRAAGREGETERLDKALERVRVLLGRRNEPARSGRRRSAASSERIDRQIEELLLEAELDSALYEQVLVELRERRAALSRLGAADGATSTEDLSRDMGLPVEAFRERMRSIEARARRLDEARNRFVEHNLRLVIKVAREFLGMGVPLTDLVQEGNLGVLRAVEKFDYRRGFKFSTYGCWWIRQACIRAIQNYSRTVRIPSHRFDRVRNIRRTETELVGRLGRAPDHTELSAELGMSPEKLEDHLVLDQRPVSLDTQLSASDDRTIGDVTPDPTTWDPIDDIHRHRTTDQLGALVTALPSREQQVLRWRFGLTGEGPCTLAEIGHRLGLSRERIRQIESGALDRLRSALVTGDGGGHGRFGPSQI